MDQAKTNIPHVTREAWIAFVAQARFGPCDFLLD
jgi:hypothetical protein